GKSLDLTIAIRPGRLHAEQISCGDPHRCGHRGGIPRGRTEGRRRMTVRRTVGSGCAGLAALALAVPLALLPAGPAAAIGLGGSLSGDSAGLGTGAPDAAAPVETKLTAADGAHGDLFGQSVAFDGDTALIGAPGVDVNGQQDQGAAYVFTRTGDGWVERQKLLAPDGAARHEFGLAVALAGDTAVVGSRTANSVYVFGRQDGQWTLQSQLTRP